MVQPTSATPASMTASNSSPSKLPSSSPRSARSACVRAVVAARGAVDLERRRLAVLVTIGGVIVVSILGAAADVLTPGEE